MTAAAAGNGAMADKETVPPPGPDVRMCDNPDCNGPGHCYRMPPAAFMGLADSFSAVPPDEVIIAIFRQDLVLNYASDSAGVRRMLPDGCEFTVHRSTIPTITGKRQFIAVYSGPCGDRDEVLAGAPEYDPQAAVAQVERMKEAGLFDAALAWQPDVLSSAAGWQRCTA